MAGMPKRRARRNPTPTGRATKREREAMAVWGVETDRRMRAEEASAKSALGASPFKWSANRNAYGDGKGDRVLAMLDDPYYASARSAFRTSGMKVSLDVGPRAPSAVKYAVHSILAGLDTPDAWKARNAFDAWVEATPGGWDG